MNNIIKQDLDMGWKFLANDADEWHTATVPGCVHLDLLANDLICEPFYGTNEKDLQWISNKDWSYKLIFEPELGLLGREKILLKFHGLDTYAEVFLNKKKILEADNMFHPWEADVKGIFKEGENELLVNFHSPINKILPILRSSDHILPADNDQIKNTSPYTRKAPYHYGWDWGPSFATSGIWQPVELVGLGEWSIESAHIVQKRVSNNKAELTLEMDVDSSIAAEAELLIVEERSNTKISKKLRLKNCENHIRETIILDHPDLWWPIGHGDQNLYEFQIRLETKNGREELTKRIGIRDLRVEQKKDAQGMGFTFVINGKPIFSKGANWIPADSFTTRLTKQDYEKLLKSAVRANMNTLRVWGGGIYESDDFYDLCDEMGILVWQDFMFACSLYPGDKAFLNSVEREARYQVGRLKDHPSIVL